MEGGLFTVGRNDHSWLEEVWSFFGEGRRTMVERAAFLNELSKLFRALT
jgi:hypothetical protein